MGEQLPIFLGFVSLSSVFLLTRFKTSCFKLYVHVPEASGKLSSTDSSRWGRWCDVCRTRHGRRNQSGGGIEGREAWVCEISCIMQTELLINEYISKKMYSTKA